MSAAHTTFFMIIGVSILATLIGVLYLLSRTVREVLTGKLALLAFLIFPWIEWLLALLVVQLDAVGFTGLLSGTFKCSSIHGGGYSSCGFGGAMIDAFLVAAIFNVVTLGLVSVAVYIVTLAVLALIKQRSRVKQN